MEPVAKCENCGRVFYTMPTPPMIDRYAVARWSSAKPLDGTICGGKIVSLLPQTDYAWNGDGPEPRRWTAPDGTTVYRSYVDYCES